MLTGVVGLVLWVGLQLGETVYPGFDATVISFFGVILILSQIGEQSVRSRCLAWWPLVSIGQVSYGVYLWQQLLMGPRIPGFEVIRLFPVSLVATFVIAVVSYQFLERPIIQLKNSRFHSNTPKVGHSLPFHKQ